MTHSARRVRDPRFQSAPQRFHAPDARMEALAQHCLAARQIIGEHGSPVMRRLIDLLLLEVGEMAANDCQGRRVPREQLEEA